MSDMMYGQIIAHSEEADDIGETVTFTDETGSYSTGTIGSDGYCRKKLAAFKVWTVTFGDFTSDPVYLGCGENHFIECGLTTDNWAGIKRIVDAGKAADYITNGDRFTVELTNGETLIYEANVNTYGLGEVDFIPTYCLETARYMNTSNTNAGGWNACNMRSYLNDTFKTMLPADLQAVISIKENQLTQGSQVNTLITSQDYIWLPAEFEIFGARTYSGSAEDSVHRQYPIFTDAASRVRTLGANGAAVGWWESSPNVSASAYFCYVTTSGAANSSPASNAYGVAPCFRIAP